MTEDETRRVIGPSFDPDGPGYELDHAEDDRPQCVHCAGPLCTGCGGCWCEGNRCHRFADADRGAYDMAPPYRLRVMFPGRSDTEAGDPQ